LRILSTDSNGATLRATTSIVVTSGARYLVTLWVRSRGTGGCSVNVEINGVVVASSGTNVPTDWTRISGFYNADQAVLNPALAIVVSCPAIGSSRRRQANSSGVDMEDLSMDVAGASDTTSTTATTSVSTSSVESSSQSSITLTTSTTTSDVATSTTVSASSTSASPLVCSPVIQDPSFEISGASSVSSDWTIATLQGSASADNYNMGKPIIRTTQNVAHSGSYIYIIITNSIVAENFTLQYLHPISLCVGVAYEVGLWARVSRSGVWSPGCRVVGYLGEFQVFSDLISEADQTYRYIGGTFTPATDMPAASFKIVAVCPVAQRNLRGVM